MIPSPNDQAEFPGCVVVGDALPILERLLGVFATLTDWDKGFVATLTMVISSGKVSTLTDAQYTKLVSIFALRVLTDQLPPAYRQKSSAPSNRSPDA